MIFLLLPCMRSEKDIKEIFRNLHEHYIPHVSIDCIIFGFHNNQLKVLIMNFKNIEGYGLPGGYIRYNENMDDAARRILKERTGLDHLFLQQFYTFGNTDRLNSITQHDFLRMLGIEAEEHNRMLDRTLSIGYYALVEFSKVNPTPDIFSKDCSWWDVESLPSLWMDHNQIVEKALQTLRRQLHYQPIGFNLLPEKFTMPELQKLYETILGKALDRRNFQKKMLSFGILERLKERKHVGPHKSPYLYRFDPQRYTEALNNGLKFGF